MSFLGRLLPGKGRGDAAAPSTSNALQRLHGMEEMMQKKIDFLEQKIEEEIATARKNGTKNKRVAIQALKRKKRYDQQLKQADHTLTTLEFQRQSLEEAATTAEVMDVMMVARDAMKQASRGTKLEDVEQLVDDMHDMRDLVEEVNSAFGMLANNDDDDELEAELEALEEEALADELSRVHLATDVSGLPSVPDEQPTAVKGKSGNEAGELRELEDWFAA